jgi:hypothetical protein
MTGLRGSPGYKKHLLDLKSLGIEQAEYMKQTFLRFRKL